MARVLLLVPSATYRAPDFLDAARALGVEVVVASDHDQPLGGIMGERSLTVALDDPVAAATAIVAHDRQAPIDAVVAVDDQGTVVAAEAARRLGLVHNDPAAVRAARDKAAMRRALAAAEVPQPAFTVLPAHAEGQELRRLVAQVGYPAVVKPTTLSGSQGVLRVDGEDALEQVVARVRAIASGAGVAGDAPLLAEQFVGGPEIAVEGLLEDGRLRVLAVFDKPDPLDGPAFEETIYVTPSRHAAGDLRAAKAATEAATRALGLRHGPVHAELRVGGGRASVIEVAARTIGGLCARTLRFGTGRRLEELVLAQALGRPLPPVVTGRAAGVLMIPIPRAGVLRAVDGRQEAATVPGVTGIEITVANGRPVAPVPEGNRYLGFVFARARDPAAVEQALRQAGSKLHVQVEPGDVDVDGEGNGASCT